MTALRTLFLDSNELSGTIPESLARLTNLEQLYLSGNQLSGTLFSDFGKLIKLSKS
jgi:Leucine-rich repeat (LRR) protein